MKQIVDKRTFFGTLSKAEQCAGYIKFNIPDAEHLDDLNGEGVWGWVTPEDRVKYNDDTYTGKITAILCNEPLMYHNALFGGAEVVLQCHGESRPTLDPEWVREYLL